MSNTVHPLETQVMELHRTLNLFVHLAVRDGTIDAEERALQERIRQHKDEIAEFNCRRAAAESFEKNGDSRHTRSLFRQVDVGLVDLAKERQARRPNVIQFPGPQRDEAS